MIKKELNECIDCGHISDEGLWYIEKYKGPQHIQEYFKVKCHIDGLFNLDDIDAQKLIDKYKITSDEAEELIMNGEPACPKCKSLNYFEYRKEV